MKIPNFDKQVEEVLERYGSIGLVAMFLLLLCLILCLLASMFLFFPWALLLWGLPGAYLLYTVSKKGEK